MDLFLVAILTFFAVLIGGIFWWSNSSNTRQGLPNMKLDIAPEAVIEMTLEEILAEKNAAAPEGNSFKFSFGERENYLKLKSDADGKPLQAALLKRCIECLTQTMTFDSRVKIVYESYNNLVPRETAMYLNGIKVELTTEIEAIKTEANVLKEGWGATIFNQAMDLTVGLQRRKEARQAAEEQKVVDAINKEKEKANAKRLEEEAKLRAQREADKAYKALMGEKPNSTSQKKSTTSSQKK